MILWAWICPSHEKTLLDKHMPRRLTMRWHNTAPEIGMRNLLLQVTAGHVRFSPRKVCCSIPESEFDWWKDICRCLGVFVVIHTLKTWRCEKDLAVSYRWISAAWYDVNSTGVWPVLCDMLCWGRSLWEVICLLWMKLNETVGGFWYVVMFSWRVELYLMRQHVEWEMIYSLFLQFWICSIMRVDVTWSWFSWLHICVEMWLRNSIG